MWTRYYPSVPDTFGSPNPGLGKPRANFNEMGPVAAHAEGRASVLNEPAHELPEGFAPATGDRVRVDDQRIVERVVR